MGMILSKKRASEIAIEVLQGFAREAAEKHLPKSVIESGQEMAITTYICPMCDSDLFTSDGIEDTYTDFRRSAEHDGQDYSSWGYCPYCGQKLEFPDWHEKFGK